MSMDAARHTTMAIFVGSDSWCGAHPPFSGYVRKDSLEMYALYRPIFLHFPLGAKTDGIKMGRELVAPSLPFAFLF